MDKIILIYRMANKFAFISQGKTFWFEYEIEIVVISRITRKFLLISVQARFVGDC